MEVHTPGARLRRLLTLCQLVDASDDDRTARWRQLRPDELVDALRSDPDVPADLQLTPVVESLARDRDEVPTALRAALARVFGVPATYFDDPEPVTTEDAELVTRLLVDLGVTAPCVCRVPGSSQIRLAAWSALLEVARQHSLTDGPDGPPDRRRDDGTRDGGGTGT